MPPEREKAIELRQAICRGEVQPKRKRKPPPMIKKICGVCGKEFETRLSKQKHCSDECRYNTKLKLNERIRELTKQNKKQYSKKCAICGEDFITSVSIQVYCSDKCKKKINNRRISDYLKLGMRDCVVCGKKFQPKRSLMSYCSMACRDARNDERYNKKTDTLGKKEFIQTKCPMCGKIYNRMFASGWIGNGTPRVNCYSCEQFLINKPSLSEHYSIYI